MVTTALAPVATAVHAPPSPCDSRYSYDETPLPVSVEPEAETVVGVVTQAAEPPVTLGAEGAVTSIVQLAWAVFEDLPCDALTANECLPGARFLYTALLVHAANGLASTRHTVEAAATCFHLSVAVVEWL